MRASCLKIIENFKMVAAFNQDLSLPGAGPCATAQVVLTCEASPVLGKPCFFS